MLQYNIISLKYFENLCLICPPFYDFHKCNISQLKKRKYVTK